MLSKRVLITGGGTGIGYGLARTLAELEYKVVIAGRRQEVLQKAANALAVDWLTFDVAQENPALIFAAYPDISIIIHNAGFYAHLPLGAWSADAWDQFFKVHVTGPALLTQEFAKRNPIDGSVIFINSTLALRQKHGSTLYSVSKAAQLSLAASLAQQLAPQRIRVNSILPGVIPTGMTTKELGLDNEEQAQTYRQLHPLGRMGTVEDIAKTVVFILQSEWITGAQFVVDGGLLIRMDEK